MNATNDNENAASCTTQNARIRRYLEQGHALTGLEALRMFGCMRLPSRIWDIREGGLQVSRRMVTRRGKRVAEYSAVQAKTGDE